MSNVIGKIKRKMARDKEIETGARILAIKQLVNQEVSKTFQTILTVLFVDLHKEFPKLTYESINYLMRKLVEGIQHPEQKELFDALSAINYSDGEGKGVVICNDGLIKFIELSKGYVTLDRCIEILNTYNRTSDKLETLIDAAKFVNEKATGEEFEVVTQQ